MESGVLAIRINNAVKILMVFLLFSAAIMAFVFFPVSDWLQHVHNWRSQNPVNARLLVGLSFVGFALFMLPAIPVVMLSGFLFGLLEGFIVIWFAGCLASAITFWTGRKLLGGWLHRGYRPNDRYMMINRAVISDGIWIAVLSRMAMVVPYAPLNYFFSVTNIRFKDYWLGTNLGILPAYFLPVYLGTGAHDVSAVITGDVTLSAVEMLLLFVYLSGVLLLTFIVARSAGRKLEAELADAK